MLNNLKNLSVNGLSQFPSLVSAFGLFFYWIMLEYLFIFYYSSLFFSKSTIGCAYSFNMFALKKIIGINFALYT